MTVSKEIELPGPVREHGREAHQPGGVQDQRRCRRRDDRGDGAGQRDLSRGLQGVTAGINPMALKRGIDRAVIVAVEQIKTLVHQGPQATTTLPRWPRSPPTATKRSASCIAEAIDKVGTDGVVEVEEGKSPTRARSRRGHAVRQGLPLPVLHDRSRRAGVRARGSLHPDLREEDLATCQDLLPLLEQGRHGRQAVPHHRRGSRERGPGDPGGQPAPRHAQDLRGQGPRLRRPPQGHARGHRDPDRRYAHLRGPGRQT